MRRATVAVCLLILASAIMGCATAGGQQKGVVDHLVLIKLKTDATRKQIDDLTGALLSLKDEVPGIIDIGAGVNNSPEGQDKGHNYALFVRLKDAATRDAYLIDPRHQSVVVEYAVPILEDLTIVDFMR